MGEKEGRKENEVFNVVSTIRSQRILDAVKSLNGDTLVVMTIDRKIEMLNFIQEEAEKLKLLLLNEKERRKLKRGEKDESPIHRVARIHQLQD